MVAHRPTDHGGGVALCLTSAVAFGLMAIFAKQAYAAGVTVATLLPCASRSRRVGSARSSRGAARRGPPARSF
jgi:hypothetical protein